MAQSATTPSASLEPRRNFERAVRLLNLMATAIGVLVLLGWQFKVELLKSIVPGYITMKANTALGLLMLSVATSLLGRSRPGQLVRAGAGLLALAAIALGVLTLAEYLFSMNFGIDEIMFIDPVGYTGKFPPGRLAPITAVNLIFIGTALARSAHKPTPAWRRPDFLLLIAFVLAFQGFIGYVSGITYTFGSAFYTQMALHTSIAFMCICLSLLFAKAQQGFVGLLLADAPGGRLARRLVASALIVPPLVNWLQNLAQRAHLLDADFGVLLRVLGDSTFFLVVIWRTTSSLHLSDTERQASDAERQALSEALSAREQSERDMILAREYAVEASRLKSEFLANMSHEIRTPINGVIGMAGMLADTQLTPQQAEYLEYIGRSAEALLTVINDILDFSKVEAGKLELENVDFDISQLIADIGKTMGFTAKQKSLAFVFQGPQDLQYLSIGDAGRIRQILLNFLSNAIKFTASGHVELRVSVVEATASADTLLFEVLDSGIGIPEHILPKLFSAFQQADSSTTRRYGGTGLGLSICKKLIELMGGTLGVRSVEGQGSTFWFKLTASTTPSATPSV